MDRHTTHPEKPLPVAATGHYVAGFLYLSGHEAELRRFTDFQPAQSVEDFVDGITVVARNESIEN
jgi:hypothetical protein